MRADATTGVSGPNGIYPSLATKLATHHIPTLRLDYRAPSRTPQCTNDILAGMDWMEREEGVEGVVLVGWSFGSAPTIGVGARERRDGAKGRVRGVANVAPQTAETSGIHDLAPTPVLFLHGTGDACLSPRCSQNLYASYGEYGSREIELYEGDNHGLTNSSAKAERRLFEFITRCLGVSAEEETAQAKLADGEEGVQMMKEGHDLEHGERL
ncbi:alpha/beta-hydrolase [Saitoella complicata NRRL Y-17804]|uniref:alpha/beta-hydrolase n=1 Tax=Saitoella complicata (strain BCRC 22490 / CBS 7301 / JCM 7358 / NBRC 10748 / NRRL Y-17804) TaxID=698492 RepID=UPI0008682627|nr:alpha/beta-hydrolase [Saitoella complicata NRRL Y-17804]ODQ55414.1 alpha/beta-hydrolase [Saitoella complicata NRRL Y-17804]